MKIDVLKKSDLDASIQDQICGLFRELSADKKQVNLHEILDKKNQLTLVFCKDNEKILGIASMCTYKVISGKKGWIEDVVVSSSARGKGIGRKLINKLIEIGKEKKLSEILLFTEYHRLPAINLYLALGFEAKESRIYSLKME